MVSASHTCAVGRVRRYRQGTGRLRRPSCLRLRGRSGPPAGSTPELGQNAKKARSSQSEDRGERAALGKGEITLSGETNFCVTPF